jgi:alpha-beta hydrolase superfamily lysophospholipase
VLCTRGRDANLAAAFAAAGLNALVFDHRNRGVSDGDNRQHPHTTHMTLYSDKSKVDAAAKIATRWFVETL